MRIDSPRLIARFVAALQQQPAYLLVFALAFLMVLLAGYCLFAGFLKDENKTLLLCLAFGSLAFALLVSAFVIHIVDAKRPPRNEAGGPERTQLKVATGDDKLDATLTSIVSSLGAGLKADSSVFHAEMRHELDDLNARAADWSQGQMLVPPSRYNKVLIELYRQARESVFSTTIPQYLPTWPGPLGQRMLEAHRRGHAIVTRVFVFNERREVTAEAMQIIKAQSREDKIRTRIYIDQEDEAFSFPVDISRDFTVIDHGRAIGVTQTFGGEHLSARWYFDDERRKQLFDHYRKALEAGSIDFSDFNEWWLRQGGDRADGSENR
jgi:hypothetical protein